MPYLSAYAYLGQRKFAFLDEKSHYWDWLSEGKNWVFIPETKEICRIQFVSREQVLDLYVGDSLTLQHSVLNQKVFKVIE